MADIDYGLYFRTGVAQLPLLKACSNLYSPSSNAQKFRHLIQHLRHWIGLSRFEVDNRPRSPPKCIPTFRFKSTNDSSEKHFILSRLMIRFGVIPMSDRQMILLHRIYIYSPSLDCISIVLHARCIVLIISYSITCSETSGKPASDLSQHQNHR